jgi:hypothetical protein
MNMTAKQDTPAPAAPPADGGAEVLNIARSNLAVAIGRIGTAPSEEQQQKLHDAFCLYTEAVAATLSSRTPAGAAKMPLRDVVITGPVNGMGEPDPAGSYFRLVLTKGDAREERKLSRGAVEVLSAEIAGLLDRSTPAGAAGDPVGEAFRVGRRVPRNVYEGDRPLFMAATAEEAARLVGLLNATRPASPAPAASGDELRDDVLFAFHRYVKNPTPFEVTWWARHFPQFAKDIREHAVEVIDMNFMASRVAPVGSPVVTAGAVLKSFIVRDCACCSDQPTVPPDCPACHGAGGFTRYQITDGTISPAPAAAAGGEGATEREYDLVDEWIDWNRNRVVKDNYLGDTTSIYALRKLIEEQIGLSVKATLAPAAQVNPGREEIVALIRAGLVGCSLGQYVDSRHVDRCLLATADAILAARPVAEGDAGETR